MRKSIGLYLMIGIFGFFETTYAQQSSDDGYQPVVEYPEYASEKGTKIYLDQAHYNFHTKAGRYAPFSRLLEADGYQVVAFNEKFMTETLDSCIVLVVANALNKRNLSKWSLPTPSAFTKEEILALNNWVKNGGSLFLIADHMPFPGAAEELALSFGFRFNNGFTMNPTRRGQDIFTMENGMLKKNTITTGRSQRESIASIQTFGGQSFTYPDGASPILLMDKDYVNLFPKKAWQFDENTKRSSAAGLSQGAYMTYGEGRLAVFGEAAMFSAQKVNGQRFGMSLPSAQGNEQLLLNIIHWLDKRYD